MLVVRNRYAVLVLAVALSFGLTTCGGGGSSKKSAPRGPDLFLILPQGGTLDGGNTVALFTRDFTDNFMIYLPTVEFDGAPATNVFAITPVELTVTVPQGAATGPVNVTLTSTDVVESATCVGCYNYISPPTCTVTGVPDPQGGPARGDVAGGNIFHVTGLEFTNGAQVFVCGVKAPSANLFDPTLLSVVAPASPGGVPGFCDVEVRLSNGAVCVFPLGYEYTIITCTLASVTPNTGSIAGDDFVTLLGVNFDPAATVDFGGLSATQVTWQSTSEITCRSPVATLAEAVPVTVTNSAVDTCTLDPGFTYFLPGECTISEIDPPAGDMGPTNKVTIRGSGFEETPLPRVQFGPSFGVVTAWLDASTLEVDVPAAVSPGKVTVTVTNQVSLQTCTKADGYEYIGPGNCALLSVSPSQGPTFDPNPFWVVLRGVSLDPSPVEIQFGPDLVDPANINVISPTEVEVIPPNPTGGEGVVDVVYVNPGPTPCSLFNGYEYKDPATGCTITTITPNSGGRQGGTFVTIVGLDFCDQPSGGVRVFFGGVPANGSLIEVTDTTRITCYTPGRLNPGTVDVSIIGVGCQVTCSLPNGFTYTDGCSFTGMTPSTGPSTGGTQVTIIGSSFDPLVSVRFGLGFARNVVVQSSTTITCETPPSDVSGPVDVLVMGGFGGQCRRLGGFNYTAGPGGPGCTVGGTVPNSGSPFGGENVSVTGADFDPGPPLPGVLFGSNPAEVISVNAFSVNVITPTALHQEPVDVTVVNANGDVCTLVDGYKYEPLPQCDPGCTLTNVLPDMGFRRGGELGRVEGTDFCDGLKVWFGGKLAVVLSVSPTQIMIRPPSSDATVFPDLVWVAVEQPGGSVCYMPDAYTYQ